MVRHQLGGQRIIGTHSLIDDVIAVDILQLRQFNGLFAGGRLARDADIHRIAFQAHQFGTIAVAPVPQRSDVIFRRGAGVPIANMQMCRDGGGIIGWD